MAEVALTEAWSRVDADLSLAAGNYRLQVSGIVQLALGSSAPTDDSDALTYFPPGKQFTHPATVPFKFATGNANRLWARAIGSPFSATKLKAVPAASFEPFA